MFIVLVLATTPQHERPFAKNVEEAFAFAAGGFAACFAGAEIHLMLFTSVAAHASIFGANDSAVVAAAAATPDTSENSSWALLELNLCRENGESGE